ncbi:MAG: hypothetical protein AB7U81_06145 [Thiohalomonadaceae bacterium]
MERTFLGVLFLLFASGVNAGQFALLLNGHAMHLRESPGFENELNYGLGLQYDFRRRGRTLPFGFLVGFQDSHRDPSYAAGGGYRWRLIERFIDLDVGLTGMLMTRRTYNGGDPFPAILPMAMVGMGRVAMNVLYVPDVHPDFVPVLFFQMRFAID